MAMNGVVKQEEDMTVKQEAESTPIATFMEEDDFEDTGELTIPPDLKPMWLTRIPKILWDTWASLDEEEEVKIGNIRVWQADGQGQEQKMKLLLNPGLEQHKDVPKEYDLTITNMRASNIFAFSEKDLPGYKPHLHGRGARTDKSSGAGSQDHGSRGGNRVQKYKPGMRYRRSIPKHTALAGRADHELKCVPTETLEYQNLMGLWADKLSKPKHTTTILSNDPLTLSTHILHQSGMVASTSNFNTFIKTATPSKPARPQENKHARIAQNELLDRLHNAFSRYKYWSLKALKAETRQPEAYLKETLLKIATLVKSGPFAMTYTLNPEAQMSTYRNIIDGGGGEQLDEAAPDGGGGAAGEEEDEDEGDEGAGADGVKVEGQGGGQGTGATGGGTATVGEEDVGGDDDENVDMEDVL